MPHIQIEPSEHCHLHRQIEPGEVDETGDVEGDGTGVECEDVRPFHQGETEAAELVAEALRHPIDRAVALLERRPELLELRRLLLLTARVVDIGDEEKLVDDVALPRCLPVDLLLLDGVVELAARLALQKEEMDLAVVVGESALTGVERDAREPGEGVEHERGDDAVALRRLDAQPLELQLVMEVEAEGQRMIDGEEPHVASGTVEDASQLRLLARHASQLTVGTVIEIRPCQQEYRDDVADESLRACCPVTAREEEVGRSHTDDHRENRHRVRMHVQRIKQPRPLIADRTRPHHIQPLLRVVRLICLLNLFLHLYNL